MVTIQRNKSIIMHVGWITFCCCLLVFCLTERSFAREQVVRVVVSSDAAPYKVAADALKEGLNIPDGMFLSFSLDTLMKQLPASIREKDNGVWVAVGSRAADYLHSVLEHSVPLVYCMVAKPESIGLQKGPANVSGVAITLPITEQFALIQRALPYLQSIGILYRSSSSKSMNTLNEARTNLPEHWQLQAVDIDSTGSMAKAIQKLFAANVGLIWTTADSSVYNRATVKALLLASLRNKTPVFGFSGSFVKAGALLGLEADPVLQGRYAAVLVMNILTHKEKIVPVERAGVSLAVNMVVADRLGISLPVDVVKQSHVIGVD